jgi:hypothetical protein
MFNRIVLVTGQFPALVSFVFGHRLQILRVYKTNMKYVKIYRDITDSEVKLNSVTRWRVCAHRQGYFGIISKRKFLHAVASGNHSAYICQPCYSFNPLKHVMQSVKVESVRPQPKSWLIK